jgi:hypothetical protein
MSDTPNIVPAPIQYVLTEHAKKRLEERSIQQEWLERTIFSPDLLELDSEDPTKRHAFKVIPENGDRVLRVIYNESTTPWSIISTYFERKRKGTL